MSEHFEIKEDDIEHYKKIKLQISKKKKLEKEEKFLSAHPKINKMMYASKHPKPPVPSEPEPVPSEPEPESVSKPDPAPAPVPKKKKTKKPDSTKEFARAVSQSVKNVGPVRPDSNGKWF
jgi:hypothetical protein